MTHTDKLDINIFKVVTRAISKSDNLTIMADYLTQLLVGALEIKGSTLFALNDKSKELEILASFGLSLAYMNKGPLLFDQSIGCVQEKEAIVIKDVGKSDLLQYPEEAVKEGIGAIISVPIIFSGHTIGSLRLYHYQSWNISASDLDSLSLLAENIGLAMMYTRLLNTTKSIRKLILNTPIGVETSKGNPKSNR